MIGYVDAIGFFAGFFTTLASVPQILKSIRTKSTRDLSLAFIGMIAFGQALWITYGLIIGSAPVVVANVFSFALAATLIALKLKYK